MNEPTFDLLRDLGIPGGFAGGLLYVVWQTMRRLRPLAEQFIQAHLSLTRKLESSIDAQVEGHKHTHDKLEQVHGDVKKLLMGIVLAVSMIATPGYCQPPATVNAPTRTEFDTLTTTVSGKEATANKNQANGYAGLDSSGHFVGTLIHRYDTATNLSAITLSTGELALATDTHVLYAGDGSTPGGYAVSGGLTASTSVIFVQATSSAVNNGATLRSAYTAAAALTPNGAALGAANRATVVMFPGVYNITGGSGDWSIATAYVNLVGVGGSKYVTIATDATHRISVDNADHRLKGFTMLPSGAGVMLFAYGSSARVFQHEDLYFDRSGSSVMTATGDPNNVTAYSYRVKTNGTNLYPRVSTTTLTFPTTWTMEECEGSTGSFGGGNANTNITFSCRMIRCNYSGTSYAARINGRWDDCEILSGSGVTCKSGVQLYRCRGEAFYFTGSGLGRACFCTADEDSTPGTAEVLVGKNDITTPYNVIDTSLIP